MEMCSEDGKKVINGDTLGRVISGVSTFKEPLRSQRENCVCVSFWWFRLYKYSYISQDDGAGEQVPEEMGGMKSRTTEWEKEGRQQGKVH